MTLASLRRLTNQRQQMLIDGWWREFCPSRYQDINFQMRRRKLSLSRLLLYHLISTRTGHNDFAEYHRRFNHQDANLECECNLPTPFTLFATESMPHADLESEVYSNISQY